jgi:predicted phage terminase large subunit-like protein
MNFDRNFLRLSLTRRSLGRFAQAMMPAYEIDPCHQLMIELLEDLLSGKIKKLAIITPPRHGKTTLGNVIAPAYALGRNPTETIITVSCGSELSEGFGRRVRNILSDPAFREVFPGCQLSPDSAAAYRFTTTTGGEYSAVGCGGPVTGRGASLLVLDEKVEFPELKRKVGKLADAWKPSEIYVEDKASGQSLIQELKIATSHPVIPVAVDRDKETRASAVTGYFEAGKVLFPRPEAASWVADLEDELASFPGGLHDDQVDAIAQALNKLRDSGGVLGLVDLFKTVASGAAKMVRGVQELLTRRPDAIAVEAKPAPITVDVWREWAEKRAAPPCPHPDCKNASTALVLDARGNLHIFCKQCGRTDGEELPKPAGTCCENFLPQSLSGFIRCAKTSVRGCFQNGYKKRRE